MTSNNPTYYDNEQSGVLNHTELKAIAALVAYVASTQGVSEEWVRSVLAAFFGVYDIKTIFSEDYDDAIRFLIELSIGKATN